eukprot:gnl/Spiro4/26000_TR12950_c0_g1_i1.p1 gnl/Spiro4/26000_TR12950_c0_g1~~gnl/Spiro4/26000_TR12950_c0_g1_i1.p1  ORF type:complete len:411 (+),score=78.55 gnl/Spiro4/26000_TR12950_c0_g1_i1:137-1234(+)
MTEAAVHVETDNEWLEVDHFSSSESEGELVSDNSSDPSKKKRRSSSPRLPPASPESFELIPDSESSTANSEPVITVTLKPPTSPTESPAPAVVGSSQTAPANAPRENAKEATPAGFAVAIAILLLAYGLATHGSGTSEATSPALDQIKILNQQLELLTKRVGAMEQENMFLKAELQRSSLEVSLQQSLIRELETLLRSDHERHRVDRERYLDVHNAQATLLEQLSQLKSALRQLENRVTRDQLRSAHTNQRTNETSRLSSQFDWFDQRLSELSDKFTQDASWLAGEIGSHFATLSEHAISFVDSFGASAVDVAAKASDAAVKAGTLAAHLALKASDAAIKAGASAAGAAYKAGSSAAEAASEILL